VAGRRRSGNLPSSGALSDELAGQSKPAQIPNLNVDPVWSLKPWPATVLLGAQEFTVPAMGAADWLAYLMQAAPDFDGLILDFFGETEEMLYAGKVSVDDLYETILDLISTVCARPWWVALRQISVARGAWHVLGPKMLAQLDFERVSIAAFLDVLMVVTLESMDVKDTTMFVLKLEAPPVEVGAEVAAPIDSMEMDRGAFLSMQ
jgi:hypothetical protein